MVKRVSSSILRPVAAFAVVAGAVAPCAPLEAQRGVDIGPIVAYYRPVGSFEPASVYSISLPARPSDLSGLAWGGEARLWLTRRFGVEVQGAVAPSSVREVTTPAGPRGPTSAQILTVAAQALYNVVANSERYRVWLSAGTGLVRRSGDAYAPYGSPVDITGVVGAGASRSIAAQWHVTAGVATLLYQFKLDMPQELRLNSGSIERGFQTDVLIHAGLTWTPH